MAAQTEKTGEGFGGKTELEQGVWGVVKLPVITCSSCREAVVKLSSGTSSCQHTALISVEPIILIILHHNTISISVVQVSILRYSHDDLYHGAAQCYGAKMPPSESNLRIEQVRLSFSAPVQWWVGVQVTRLISSRIIFIHIHSCQSWTSSNWVVWGSCFLERVFWLNSSKISDFTCCRLPVKLTHLKFIKFFSDWFLWLDLVQSWCYISV